MTWPTPRTADIVWCYVPYDHADGTTSLVRHPALVVAVDDAQSIVQIAVMGGNPRLGVLDGSYPALVDRYRRASQAARQEKPKPRA